MFFVFVANFYGGVISHIFVGQIPMPIPYLYIPTAPRSHSIWPLNDIDFHLAQVLSMRLPQDQLIGGFCAPSGPQDAPSMRMWVSLDDLMRWRWRWLHPDVKVSAYVEPRSKLHGTPRIQEVKQVNATRSKTAWDALCRSVTFRSLAVHFSIGKFSKSPSGRVCTVMSHNLKNIC